MSLNVLLIDPNEEWLGEMKAVLVKQGGYNVTCASNGADAQNYIFKNSYFVIILNFETQKHSGLQVLKYIFKNYPDSRVFFMLEDKSPIDNGIVTKEKLYKMGVLEILIRPILNEDILERLENYQSLGEIVSNLPDTKGVSDEVDIQAEDTEFTKVDIDKFYSSKKVLFDVFIRISKDHYIKILHAGDQFAKERIDKYKEKKREHLYFRKSDRRKYIMYINQMAAKVIKSPKVNTKGKVKVLGLVSENFLDQAYTIGLKPQVINQGKEVCHNICKIIEGDRNLYQLLRELNDFDPSMYSHCYLMTFFVGSLIKQFEWQTKNTIETTALACMFHDIGKMQFPKEMLAKKFSEMNENEKDFYREHPTLGAEMVDSCPRLNSTVLQIIGQHHEYYDGTGFPHGLKGKSIMTLSNIVCLIDDFVHLMEDKKLTPVDALLDIIKNKDMVYRYKTEVMEGFMKIFADPSKIKKEYRLPMNSKVVASKKVS